MSAKRRNSELEKSMRVNTVQWDDITEEAQGPINGNRDDRPLRQKYEEDNLRYKEKARLAISEQLGFVPILEASMLSEIWYRSHLKEYDRKAIEDKELKKILKSNAKFIYDDIIEYHPEQRELALRYAEKVKCSPFDERPLKEKYADNYHSEYKVAARNAIREELGFPPLLRASMYEEYCLQYNMKKHEFGVITDEELLEKIRTYSEIIADKILLEFLEQEELADTYKRRRIAARKEGKRTLAREYEEDDVEYKETARKILIEELGFDPMLEASMWPEIECRRTLKRIDEGSSPKTSIPAKLPVLARMVSEKIITDFPEQSELARKYLDENPIQMPSKKE